MTEEENIETLSILQEARLLLKLYDIEGKVDWWEYTYNGFSRSKRNRPFILRIGSKWIGLNSKTIHKSYKHVTSYKTVQSLLNAVKKLVNKTNIDV